MRRAHCAPSALAQLPGRNCVEDRNRVTSDDLSAHSQVMASVFWLWRRGRDVSVFALSWAVACSNSEGGDHGQVNTTTATPTADAGTTSGDTGQSGVPRSTDDTSADSEGADTSFEASTSAFSSSSPSSGYGEDDNSSGADTDAPTECSVDELLPEAIWDEMFLHVGDAACPGSATYSYKGFVQAAANYPSFACEGNVATRRRELVAFLAQISHETTGGWPTAPDGPHAWGLCFNSETGCENGGCSQYCDETNHIYPCVEGQTYQGRGAIQLSWNYNYGQVGDTLGVDLLAVPDLVATDPELAIATALWFWMTPQAPKPSAHDVMVGNWRPTASDKKLGRLPGFGMTTNIINGGIECNQPTTPAVEDRVGYFKRYAVIAEATVGDNLYCDQMASY